MHEAVRTDNAPQPVGPYSQGIMTNDLVFISGQLGIDPRTGRLVEGGIREETGQCLRNLEAILAKAGTNLDRVVKTTIYIVDLGLFKECNEVYTNFFSMRKPARTTVGVSSLPLGALVEIEAIAIRTRG
jgi:2-iminobutanoate/2-iminopropanoate deaminase